MNNNYDDLSTWDFWGLEEELGLILESKGYGLVNFDLTYNNQGQLAPCFRVSTKLAGKLADEIRGHGFLVSLKKHERAPNRFTYVFVKNHYPVELLPLAESFKEVMV